MAQYTTKQLNIINLQDSYTILYGILGQHIVDEMGLAGEAALREATRRYGVDRGKKRRQLHLDHHYKINMQNLFSVGSDLPSDPRFRRDRLTLIPQERTSHTLVCPMAEVWKEYGVQTIGRMYCEEFHSACFSAYAYGYTQVNLGRTLTQEGDEYCSFSVKLRPEHLPEELLSVCFAEYDPDYIPPEGTIPPADAKNGFTSLCIRIYYYMLEVLLERFGEKGRSVMAGGLEKLAIDTAKRLKKQAQDMRQPLNAAFMEENYSLNAEADSVFWREYNQYGALELLKEYFYPTVLAAMQKETI